MNQFIDLVNQIQDPANGVESKIITSPINSIGNEVAATREAAPQDPRKVVEAAEKTQRARWAAESTTVALRAAEALANDAAPWIANADKLADWALENVVVRTDRCGGYDTTQAPEGANIVVPTTHWFGLNRAVLVRHFAGTATPTRVGAHVAAKGDDPNPEDGTCKLVVIDIDAHNPEDNPERNWEFAKAVAREATSLGLEVLLTDSDGKGGFHVRVFLGELSPIADAYRLGQWLKRGWAEAGYDKPPESFPKSAKLNGKLLGGWVRLPGCHHKRCQFTRVWDGSSDNLADLLVGAAAIQQIIATGGRAAANRGDQPLVPADWVVPGRIRPASDVVRAPRLPREGDGVGLPGEDFADQHDWAEIMPYYGWTCAGKVGETTHWRRPGKTEGSSGTTNYEDNDLFWPFTNATVFEQETSYSRFAFYAMMEHDGDFGAAAKALYALGYGERAHKTNHGAFGVAGEDGEPPDFANFTYQYKEKTADGQTTTEVLRIPLASSQILANLTDLTGGWPKRVGDNLFVPSAQLDPVYLGNTARLFATIDGHTRVNWGKGDALISQERFFEFTRMNAERFDAIETVPQFPPMADAYYMHREIPTPAAGSRRVDGLLDFFEVETCEDRYLVKSFLLTLFWGGRAGARPAFLFTGPATKKGGRGIGKSTLPQVLANELVGGYVSVTAKDDIAAVKTRLLSNEKGRKRVAIIDNVKSWKFSWGDLEGLMTDSEISGRALYQGEGSRPNTLIWVLTINGASLSKDLAQRVIPIHLSRPVFDAQWMSRLTTYLRTHRWELIAEIGRIIGSEGLTPVKATRWSEWERDILAKTASYHACMGLIAERQGGIDDDEESMHTIEAFFAKKLKEAGHKTFADAADPYQVVGPPVRIDGAVVADWVCQATREKFSTSTASTFLANLGIAGIEKFHTSSRRGWVWNPHGSPANPVDLKTLGAWSHQPR